MNRIRSRTSAVTAGLAACGLIVGLALTGCSAGQLSQVATQEAAVNGTSGNVGDIALRNVHLRANQTSDYVQPGRSVELLFVATNQSNDTNDRLVAVRTDLGTVSLTGDVEVPANGVLLAGTPDGQPEPLEAVEAAESAEATVMLSKPITNGLTYDFTFEFERAGETTVAVPISAGEAPRREAAAESGETGE